ncbi:hypothetical protein CDAR_532261 [Caerostris darwini]|uniref:Uncharacterized protein n=1 Tax=Caerostris darwini TaxID=1538125 RepID=A0AAV4T890_9ARAC|nr:hypothetical protein CDAR_532261 [Caerostris darwini]
MSFQDSEMHAWTDSKIIRILAYCRRFIIRCKLGTNLANVATYLSLSEICYIKSILFRWVKERHFPDELNSLQAGKTLSPSSKILSLNPFLDNVFYGQEGGLKDPICLLNQNIPSYYQETTRLVQ